MDGESEVTDTPVSAEIWLAVRGFEGLYEVSNLGRVRSLTRVVCLQRCGKTVKRVIAGRLLRIFRSKNLKKYPTLRLSRNGRQRTHSLHQIVINEFVPNPDGLPEANHENGDKNDCRAINLKWTDRSGNMKHAVTMGLGMYGRDDWRIDHRMAKKRGIEL